MEIKISEILKKYDTDKNNGHHYGEAYDKIFRKFDRNQRLNILEIGTQRGGSLCAWQELFPNATITGIDIVDVVTEKNKNDRINYTISDIKEYRTNQTFDIVIDDGSHFLGDVVYATSTFMPKLNYGGVMVIEDVQNPEVWMATFTDLINQFRIFYPENQSRFKLSYADVRHINHQYDDFLIIIERIF